MIDVRTPEGRQELRELFAYGLELGGEDAVKILDYIDELEDKVLVLENNLIGDAP